MRLGDILCQPVHNFASPYTPDPSIFISSLILVLRASYQIRKIAGCACAGNAGNVFPRRRLQRKPLVSDPGMHHGTCVTHVPWCMSGSLTRGGGENVPGIPGACAPAILRIWQEVLWREALLLLQRQLIYSEPMHEIGLKYNHSWFSQNSSVLNIYFLAYPVWNVFDNSYWNCDAMCQCNAFATYQIVPLNVRYNS